MNPNILASNASFITLQHEGKPWFHPSIKREQAEDMLSHVRKEGAFLVRMGERILGSFAITFRAENKV